jgi:hypothetical protein
MRALLVGIVTFLFPDGADSTMVLHRLDGGYVRGSSEHQAHLRTCPWQLPTASHVVSCEHSHDLRRDRIWGEA